MSKVSKVIKVSRVSRVGSPSRTSRTSRRSRTGKTAAGTTAQKSDPILWNNVVKSIKNSDRAGPAGTWNARKAQLAVKEYKAKGGKYVGSKSPDNSLAIWTKEDWGYIDNVVGNRYLPMNVRHALTKKEKNIENTLKKNATTAHIQRASYSPSVSAKLRKSRKAR